jgi:hypothetical protein
MDPIHFARLRPQTAGFAPVAAIYGDREEASVIDGS